MLMANKSKIMVFVKKPIFATGYRSLSLVSMRNGISSKVPNFNTAKYKDFTSSSILRQSSQKDEMVHQFQLQSSNFSKTTINHKITKEELLAQANGFFDKFKIRSKWFLIRQNRPFTVDEISAVFSWVVFGHVLWIILGTTTFCSLILYLVNTVFAKEFAAKVTGKLISDGLNLDIDFEDAVFPEWKGGMIRFKNINCVTNDALEKGSNLKLNLNIDTINLTFSFQKWYNGKGLIQDLEIYGMKGSIYRNGSDNSENHDEHEFEEKQELWIPHNYEISTVKICDSAVEIYDSDRSKPLKVAIFNCEIPKLRGKWLLADFFNASNANGSINDSLFTIHKRQHKLVHLNNDENSSNYWKRVTRLRIDSIDLSNIDYNQRFNWIVNGKAEITADIMFPNDIENDDLKLSEVVNNFVNNILENTSSSNDDKNAESSAIASKDTFTGQFSKSSKYVVIDFKIKFTDLTASIPHVLPHSSSGNHFLSLNDLRSLVSYTNNLKNSGRYLLPVQTRILKSLDNLKNSTTLQESGIVDLITTEIYEELIKRVEEDEKRIIQNRSSQWSHSVASQLLLFGLGVMA